MARPSDEVIIWQWAERFVRVPLSGTGDRWSSEDAKFLREILEALADPTINEITCLCSAQSGKTVTMLVFVLWLFVNDPGPTLWVAASTPEAKKIAKTRLNPAMEMCAPLAPLIPRERGKKKDCEIYLSGGPLVIAGATDDKALQSTPYKNVILDEYRLYKGGRGAIAKKRTRSYKHTYKLIIITCPDVENDEAHTSFLEGDQCEHEVPCPSCGHFQVMRLGDKDKPGGLKFDISDAAYNGGQLDMRLILPTIRWECCACGHAVRDNEVSRRALIAGGRWVKRNPGHSPNKRSFTWNAILPHWTSWATIIEELLTASRLRKHGHIGPMKTFFNETLGLPWNKRHERAEDGDDAFFILKRKLPYDPAAPIPGEDRRFCTIDVQGKGGRHFYWEISAWSKFGESWRVAAGIAWSIAEMRSIIHSHGVKPENVGIDSGHFTQEVYKYIMESGKLPNGCWAWKAMKGDKPPGYLIDGIRYPFTVTEVDPGMGTREEMRLRPITQVLFSKSALLDMSDLAMRGAGAEWHIPTEASPENPGGWAADVLHEYCLQVTAYDRKEVRDARNVVVHEWIQTRDDDHWGSCNRMQFVCALACGLIPVVGAPVPPPVTPANPPSGPTMGADGRISRQD